MARLQFMRITTNLERPKKFKQIRIGSSVMEQAKEKIMLLENRLDSEARECISWIQIQLENENGIQERCKWKQNTFF